MWDLTGGIVGVVTGLALALAGCFHFLYQFALLIAIATRARAVESGRKDRESRLRFVNIGELGGWWRSPLRSSAACLKGPSARARGRPRQDSRRWDAAHTNTTIPRVRYSWHHTCRPTF